MLILIYLVFLSTSFGRGDASVLRYTQVNLRPFSTISHYLRVYSLINPTIIWTNIGGNILAFVPFGFLWPRYRGHDKFFRTLLASAALSAFIEVVQWLLGVGVMDIDDLILNTLGGIIGYLILRFGHNLILAYDTKKKGPSV